MSSDQLASWKDGGAKRAIVPNETGPKFSPHVTVGIAMQPYLDEMLAKPFDTFAFSPASAYQLGNFGTARKKLQTWELSR